MTLSMSNTENSTTKLKKIYILREHENEKSTAGYVTALAFRSRKLKQKPTSASIDIFVKRD